MRTDFFAVSAALVLVSTLPAGAQKGAGETIGTEDDHALDLHPERNLRSP